jgi:thiol-disulfide isomerase/thioredoxin
MIKKLLLLSILFGLSLQAYNLGDTLDKSIVNKLKLKKDKTYILDFFASWCVSCKIELPLISELNTVLDTSKYKIIGINSDQNIDEGKNFVNKLNLNFDIIYDSDNVIISEFEPIGVPAIYYVKNRIIKKVIFGAVHSIDEKIQNDLNEMEQ